MKAEEVEFGEWAIVELFGHRRAAGHVTQAQFPAGWVRLEIPAVNGQPGITQLYNPSALYGLHPVTEDVARAAAASMRPQPVQRWELERAAATVAEHVELERDDDYEGDDEEGDWLDGDADDEAGDGD